MMPPGFSQNELSSKRTPRQDLPMKLRRRWKVFWNLAAIFIIIVVVRRWDPPFDDSDMRVPRDEATPEENAYADYVRIGAMLEYGPHPKNETLARILADPAQGWPVVHALAASNRHVVAEMELVKDKPRCQEPEITDTNAELPGVTGRVALARILEICAASALERSDIDESARITNIGIQYAHHASQENQTLVAFLAGQAAQQTALSAVRRLAAFSPVNERHLEKLARTLTVCSSSTQSFDIALRGEYCAMDLHIANASRDGSLPRLVYGSCDPERIPSNRFFGILAGWTGYLPNRTRRLLHDLIKPQVESVGLPADHASLEHFWEKVDNIKSIQNSTRRWLRPNFIGEAALHAEIYAVAANSWRATCNFAELTAIYVASRRYQLRHGHYPQSLHELCPEFLNEVPVDRFDGAPIRYDATTGTIYSAWPLDQRGRPVVDALLFTTPPLTEPTGPNDKSVIVLPPVEIK